MNAPVSDGRHVYAAWGYGHTVCVDLNGTVVWRRWFPRAAQNRTQCQSGMLKGGVYVDVHARTAEKKSRPMLTGLDAKTGKTLWEAPVRAAKAGGRSGGYYVGSHKIVTLTNGGKELDVVVTTLCNIIRLKDGKEVGFLPWGDNYGPSGGPSIFNVGNVVYRGANGDGGKAPFTAFQLTLVGEDEVAAKKLWSLPDKYQPGYNSQVATPDFLVLTTGWKHDPPNIVEPLTGKAIRKAPKDNNYGGLSNVLAGRIFFFAESGSGHSRWNGVLSGWGGVRKDGKSLARFSSVDLSDPANSRFISRKNLLGGKGYPRDPAMERLAPELWELPSYRGAAWGKVCHRLHTDTGMTALGNRLFVRTTSHLYGIGSGKYDWNPQSRPADVTKTLQ
jgi:hypothetical protein